MQPRARAEWEPLRHVLMHEPGIEVFFALLSPSAHLYERFFDAEAARREHRQLRSVLSDGFGVKTTLLLDAVRKAARQDPACFEALLAFARERLATRVSGDPAHLPGRIRQAREEALRLDERDPAHLAMIGVLNPALAFSPSGITTGLSRPLHNLYFMRDQQVTTAGGIVQARMAVPEREAEVAFAGIGLAAAGCPPSGRVTAGACEGGDVIPIGDAVLIGTGPRTTPEGARSLCAAGIGCDEVALVRQRGHPLVAGHDPMVAMHLDTYCNIASESVAVGNPLLLAAAEVDVYTRDGGEYVAARRGLALDAYLSERGFSIIPITTLEQLCYASNFLCIRDGVCITPDTEAIAPGVLRRLARKAKASPERYGRLLRQAEHDLAGLRAEAEFFPHKKEVYAHGLEMTSVGLTNATGGYGGAHCMTCVLRRG